MDIPIPTGIIPNETDYGPVLPNECPSCRRRALRLIEKRSSHGLLRLFGVGGNWVIRCAQCSWILDVPKAEAPGLRKLCALAADYGAGRLSQAALAEAIRTCGLASVDRVRAREATWTCAACGESVPATLAACWNCDAPQPGLAASGADVGEPSEPDLSVSRDPLFGYALAAVETEPEAPAAALAAALPTQVRGPNANEDAAR